MLVYRSVLPGKLTRFPENQWLGSMYFLLKTRPLLGDIPYRNFGGVFIFIKSASCDPIQFADPFFWKTQHEKLTNPHKLKAFTFPSNKQVAPETFHAWKAASFFSGGPKTSFQAPKTKSLLYVPFWGGF